MMKNLNGLGPYQPHLPTYTMKSQKIKLKIDPWILHELSLGPGVDQTESYPSSGARNSLMGPRPRKKTCIESRQRPFKDMAKNKGVTSCN